MPYRIVMHGLRDRESARRVALGILADAGDATSYLGITFTIEPDDVPTGRRDPFVERVEPVSLRKDTSGMCPGCKHAIPDPHDEIDGAAWCLADMAAARAAGDDSRSVGPCY